MGHLMSCVHRVMRERAFKCHVCTGWEGGPLSVMCGQGGREGHKISCVYRVGRMAINCHVCTEWEGGPSIVMCVQGGRRAIKCHAGIWWEGGQYGPCVYRVRGTGHQLSCVYTWWGREPSNSGNAYK